MNDMRKHELSLTIICLGILIAVLHAYALAHYLYWHYAWYDIMMHFLGGALVSLGGLWIFVGIAPVVFSRTNKKILLIDVLLFTLVVGFIWEIFELAYGFTFVTQKEYVLDTTLDFIMNTIGATAAYFYALKRYTITGGYG